MASNVIYEITKTCPFSTDIASWVITRLALAAILSLQLNLQLQGTIILLTETKNTDYQQTDYL